MVHSEATFAEKDILDVLFSFRNLGLELEALAAHWTVFVVLVPMVAVEADLIALIGYVSEATFITNHFAVMALEAVITTELVSLAQVTAGAQYTVGVNKSLAVYAADHLGAVLVSQAILALPAVRTDPHS